MKHIHTLIIGAGPSGLALAYGLQGDTLVLERESGVGGLCRSINHGGGVFDVGGHSFHTPHPEVYELVQKLLEPEGGLVVAGRERPVRPVGERGLLEPLARSGRTGARATTGGRRILDERAPGVASEVLGLERQRAAREEATSGVLVVGRARQIAHPCDDPGGAHELDRARRDQLARRDRRGHPRLCARWRL